jgi:hypothetical protein
MRGTEENNFNLLIPSFGNNSTIIHQKINQQPADYVSTSEFQFEINHDRLDNYNFEKQHQNSLTSDFSPLYKKIDSDEYSLKQQHIYYQPSYTTLQRNRLDNRSDNNSSRIQQEQKQRIDLHLDYRLDKPPLPPLPFIQNAQQQQNHTPSSLLSYHQPVKNNESLNETFGLRSHHLTNLSNHHTIARQSLLDSNQPERLLMTTPIYEVADRQQQFNNSSSMHRSALLRSVNHRFS